MANADQRQSVPTTTEKTNHDKVSAAPDAVARMQRRRHSNTSSDSEATQSANVDNRIPTKAAYVSTIVIKSCLLGTVPLSQLKTCMEKNVDFDDNYTIFVLPVKSDADNSALKKLRSALGAEGVCLDRKERVWRVEIDAVSALAKVGVLGFVPLNFGIDAANGHTWTLACNENDDVDAQNNSRLNEAREESNGSIDEEGDQENSPKRRRRRLERLRSKKRVRVVENGPNQESVGSFEIDENEENEDGDDLNASRKRAEYPNSKEYLSRTTDDGEKGERPAPVVQKAVTPSRRTLSKRQSDDAVAQNGDSSRTGEETRKLPPPSTRIPPLTTEHAEDMLRSGELEVSDDIELFRNRYGLHTVWNLFRRLVFTPADDESPLEPVNFYKCMRCDSILKYDTRNASSHAGRHADNPSCIGAKKH